MENIKSENRIFGGFKPRAAFVLIFATAALLGALAPVFYEVPVFCGITVFVLSALIFFIARDFLPVCGILLPAVLELMMSGSLSLPAVYIGFIFSFAVSVYLALARRGFAAILTAAAAYAVAAVILDPMTAIVAVIPIALGLLCALMLPRYGLSATVGIITSLLICGALSAFLLLGGDLTETADALRAYFSDAYKSLNEQIFIIEESTAEMLAAYIINISPGFIFAAVSVVCFLACSLTVSLLRSSGLGEEIPESMYTVDLSPVSGILFIICFFLSAAFSIEGAEFEMYAAVAENIIIALALPFTALGCRATRDFLMRRVFRFPLTRRKISAAAVALVFIIAPSFAFALFLSIGTAYSLSPIYRSLAKKIKSTINK